MKCLGVFFVLAVLNIAAVLAGPTPSVYLNDDLYEYYSQEEFTECYVTGLTAKAKKTRSLSFPSYVTDKSNGKKYYVAGIMADLSGSAVTKITVPSQIQKSFSISDNVLKNAKNLRELKLDTTKGVSIYDNTFTGVNTDINIYGKGVESMVMDYAKKQLRENYSDFIQNYNGLSEYDTRIYLYNIAKIIRDNFKFDYNMAHGDNGAVAFALKQGSTVGLSRALRYFVIASGFNEKDIIVAGDDIQHGFCLVKLNGLWYVYDPVNGRYNDREPWSFFQTMNNYIEHTLNPYYGRLYKADASSFVVYHAKYGYSGEANPEKENLKQWLSKNNKGQLA